MSHRLLVVEDHEPSRRALVGVFRRMGWVVQAAGSVAESLTVLDSVPEPCCMILDIHLPDGTGDQVLSAIRKKNYKTRVVVCSGTLDPAHLKAVADLEPDAFVPKPITVEAIWDDMCRVCDCGAE